MAKKSTETPVRFGKRIEYLVISLLLKEGFDVFLPVVDDQGIDAIIRNRNGKIIDLQIKARSNAAEFPAIIHPKIRENYYFIFYAEKLKRIWLMPSKDFIAHTRASENEKFLGERNISFNCTRKGKEYPKKQFKKYCITQEDGTHDFSRLKKILDKLK